MVKMLKTTLGWLKSVTLSGDWGRPFYLATMTGDHMTQHLSNMGQDGFILVQQGST